MKVLEFNVMLHMAHGYLWRPQNNDAKKLCLLAKCKNFTREQIQICRELGYEIKERLVTT